MIRAPSSHLQGILEMPGFKGFPTGGALGGGYGFEPVDTHTDIPLAKLSRKLDNGRRWVHPNKELPSTYEMDKFPHIKANNIFPLSTPSTKTGKASNPETITFPNPVPPYDVNLLAAKMISDDARERMEMKQEASTIKELEEAHRIQPDAMKEAMRNARREAMLGKRREQVQKLMDLGYSEEAISAYFEREEGKSIEAALKTNATSPGIDDAMLLFARRTGTNAAGLTPTNQNQQPAIENRALRMEDLAGRPGLDKRTQLRRGADIAAEVMGGSQRANPGAIALASVQVQEDGGVLATAGEKSVLAMLEKKYRQGAKKPAGYTKAPAIRVDETPLTYGLETKKAIPEPVAEMMAGDRRRAPRPEAVKAAIARGKKAYHLTEKAIAEAKAELAAEMNAERRR